MKKQISILGILAIIILVNATLWAQSPEKMSYQAVIRDSDDNLVVNTSVGMQISILQGTADGAAVYVETQEPTTNANGLVSIEIGSSDATVVSGDFTTIDWSTGIYFIKTETDLNGGSSYTITGTSQLLSVPYALHAKTAETVSGGITETDPVYSGSEAANITATDITNLGNLSGTNTGDQDISGIATNEQAIQDTASQIRADIPDVPTGTQAGEMQYWNGAEWISVAAGNSGEILFFLNGKPTWGRIPIGMEDGDVYNPTTGKIWMDRNLGASQVATSSTDANAYGDLYQWGRAADGHQIRTSGTTSTLSSSDTPGHSNFITNGMGSYDWRSPQNDNLWQGVSGTNNPCPSGYRLPTEAEWDAERASWDSDDAVGAFDSPLKLSLAGYRYINGSVNYVGIYGRYWSSTVSGTSSRHVHLYSSFASVENSGRAYGYSVRCLKD